MEGGRRRKKHLLMWDRSPGSVRVRAACRRQVMRSDTYTLINPQGKRTDLPVFHERITCEECHAILEEDTNDADE